MQAMSIQGAFGLEHLVLESRPDPTPGPRQVVVRLRAASLNYRDLLTVRGLYNPKQPLPLVPCSDGAGVVVAVGPGAARWKVGARVTTCFSQGWLAGRMGREKLKATLGGPLDGTLRELAAFDEDGLVATPAHLSDAEAATLPCAALTAWSALTQGGLVAGDVLLVQGTGGVSTFALQLGQLMGARVIVTSQGDDKLERARLLGAWATINYRRTPAWAAAARELTGGRGVDHVVDVGGAETFPEALGAVTPGGTISVIGNLSGAEARVNLLKLVMNGVRVQGVLVGHREAQEAMNRAVAAHGLRPVIDRAFPLAEARAAFERMASAAHVGKVVVELPGA